MLSLGLNSLGIPGGPSNPKFGGTVTALRFISSQTGDVGVVYGVGGGISIGVGSDSTGAANLAFYSSSTVQWRINGATGDLASPLGRNISTSGNMQTSYTDSSGTPGAATINKTSGRSAIAAAASSCVITNSGVSATTRVFIEPRNRDATGLLPQVTTVGAGSFTVTTTANCTAALTFDWWILNGTL